MTRKPSVHVVHNPRSGWSVKKEGASRATAVVPTKDEAIHKARTISKADKTEMVIHTKDGTVQNKVNYSTHAKPSTPSKPKK
jgi:hypothetical protein